MNKIQKLKKAGLSAIQNLSAPVADIAIRLQAINPEWGLAISMGAGLLAVWRELAEDRGVELLEFIEQHKTEFSESIIETPGFKANLLNVWEKHIRENSEKKRVRLRRYLLQLGKGAEIDEDLQTKFFTTIDQMTEIEAELFGILIENSNREQFRSMHLNILKNEQASNPFDKYPEDVLQDAFHSLHSYRLLNIINAQVGKGMVVTQITEFGELFYDYIICSDEQTT